MTLAVTAARKPAARIEPKGAASRRPRTLWFTDGEWDAISATARQRGEDEPCRYARKLTMYALHLVQAHQAVEASGAMGGPPRAAL